MARRPVGQEAESGGGRETESQKGPLYRGGGWEASLIGGPPSRSHSDPHLSLILTPIYKNGYGKRLLYGLWFGKQGIAAVPSSKGMDSLQSTYR